MVAEPRLEHRDAAAGIVPGRVGGVKTEEVIRGGRVVLRQGRGFHVLAIVCGLCLLTALIWTDPQRSVSAMSETRATFGPLEPLVFVLAFGAALVLHELSHGWVGRWVGGGPVRYGTRFVLRVVPLAFWCGLDGEVSRAGMVAVLLAPQVVIPATLLMLRAVAPAVWGLCWMVWVLMVIGSSADLLMLIAVLGSHANRFRDTADGIVAATGR